MMAGTLLLLKEQGFELHYMTLSSGNCGSMVTGPAETSRIRRKESEEAARILAISIDLARQAELSATRALAGQMAQTAPQELAQGEGN